MPRGSASAARPRDDRGRRARRRLPSKRSGNKALHLRRNRQRCLSVGACADCNAGPGLGRAWPSQYPPAAVAASEQVAAFISRILGGCREPDIPCTRRTPPAWAHVSPGFECRRGDPRCRLVLSHPGGPKRIPRAPAGPIKHSLSRAGPLLITFCYKTKPGKVLAPTATTSGLWTRRPNLRECKAASGRNQLWPAVR